MKRKPPQTPGIALGCPRSCFRSVVRSHRPVVRWRQPRSIHLGDEHGCIQLVDAGGETTRRREPRGVSGTLEVSPTGSIPHRKNPARQVANDKVEASRAMLSVGLEAPKRVRPRTRVAVSNIKTNGGRNQILLNQSSRAVRAPPTAARWVFWHQRTVGSPFRLSTWPSPCRAMLGRCVR